MHELKQTISEINVLEARNHQLKALVQSHGVNATPEIIENETRLSELHTKRNALIKNVDVTQPQYAL